jgi:hypothetical protein
MTITGVNATVAMSVLAPIGDIPQLQSCKGALPKSC